MAVVMEGPLSKWTNVVKGWQYRWFVLDDNTGLLSYYTSKEKMMRGSRRGCLRLKNAAIGIDDEDDSTFTISCDQKTFHFQARDAEERDRWVRALEDTIMRHSQTRKRNLSHLRGFHPGEENLNKRLDEAQAYYNLLTDQVKALQQKLDSEENNGDSERYEVLREESAKMLAAIGKSLGLMHEAQEHFEAICMQKQQQPVLSNEPLLPMVMDHYGEKVPMDPTSHPMNDECFTHINTADVKQHSSEDVLIRRHSESDLTVPVESTHMMVSHPDKVKSKSDLDMSNDISPPVSATPNGFVSQSTKFYSIPSIAESSTAQHTTDPVAITGKPVVPKPNTLGFSISPPGYKEQVPIRSYSSSEDEDEMEFFDADEYHNHGNASPSVGRADVQIMRLHSESGHDVIADEEMETGGKDGESMEEHHSILMHLLSQVRLGMDLTKVTLPTFVLEKRSLLEMYADFFAHPDLFVSIADGANPKDRMVRLVRYYLSTFHAGRKASVAKKPYNPILGEMFKCMWSLEDEKPKDSEREKVTDGPVPFATKGDVTFLAEQVSHHPPISAFYAEHYDKRISFCAHIWTKSKFLGLSVGVENVGQGCVSVLDHDEEYIVTFPNGYCRSILSVPWVELGGKINITCPKTGYYAYLQFHCKPFYGGKKHRVTGEVMGPNDKKPFLTVQGEWNGVIYAKFEGKEEEVFIDTTTLPITQKKLQKIEKQAANESRRMWTDVTNALKDDDIDMATEAKHKLEEKQRADARYRKENHLKWETKLFHEVGEHWIYDNPLQKRLQQQQQQQQQQQEA